MQVDRAAQGVRRDLGEALGRCPDRCAGSLTVAAASRVPALLSTGFLKLERLSQEDFMERLKSVRGPLCAVLVAHVRARAEGVSAALRVGGPRERIEQDCGARRCLGRLQDVRDADEAQAQHSPPQVAGMPSNQTPGYRLFEIV